MTGTGPTLFLAATLVFSPGFASAQDDPLSLLMREPEPIMSIASTGRVIDLRPTDIAALEISESGGITDMFLRLEPDATDSLTALTGVAVTSGEPVFVSVCGTEIMRPRMFAPVDSGTIYMPGFDAVQAETLRALWHGRETCGTLDTGVFDAQ
ncbi:hypothetical protein HKCCE2091_17120 [Rhodobacterales bacterium HKCCE2091]|nr:hypothetical protein [Rhodobacterales bacterium HKCCE2091]